MLALSALVAHHARYRPDRLALVFENERLTWREFAARVARCANALRALGIGKGDKVATLLGNSRELLEVYWAVPSLGAVLVPLSPLLTASGLQSLLGDSDAKVLVTQRSLAPAAAQAPGVRVVCIDDDYAALTAAAGESCEPAPVGPDDLFNIMYTSGTTGLPKGIMHTHFVRSMYALLLGPAWRMTPESRVLHTGAIVFNGAFVKRSRRSSASASPT
jgi:acyl-coenzyme A synthetase/AMP-(fatty) acid ligase